MLTSAIETVRALGVGVGNHKMALISLTDQRAVFHSKKEKEKNVIRGQDSQLVLSAFSLEMLTKYLGTNSSHHAQTTEQARRLSV